MFLEISFHKKASTNDGKGFLKFGYQTVSLNRIRNFRRHYH